MFGALGFAGAFAHSIAIARALFSSAGGAAALLERHLEIIDRRTVRIIREGESAVMDTDAHLRAEELMRLDSLGRIDMNGPHKPAREIGADGDERELKAFETLPDLGEMR